MTRKTNFSASYTVMELVDSRSCPWSGCWFEAKIEDEMILHIDNFHATPDPKLAGLQNEDQARIAECPVHGCCEQVSALDLTDHLGLHCAEMSGEIAATQDPECGGGGCGSDETESAKATSASDGDGAAPATSDHGSSPNRPRRRHRQRHTRPRNRVVEQWIKIFANSTSARRSVDGVAAEKAPPPSGRPDDSKARGRHRRVCVWRFPAWPPPPTAVLTWARWKGGTGVHAGEKQMPKALALLLRSKGQVVAAGVPAVLSQLLDRSATTKRSYLCHPGVQHVSKLTGEGGFCGYRNIQMLVSYINAVGYPGAVHFQSSLPSIFDIQEYVERAWDMGINAEGRVETGGIRNTRKFIGTSEAQAMFCSLGIPCEAQAFSVRGDRAKATGLLFRAVEDYFLKGTSSQSQSKVHHTMLPPIYLQYQGHSLTIIGLETTVRGETNLLVFDPGFRDSDQVSALARQNLLSSIPSSPKHPDRYLGPYRRGLPALTRHGEFEILRLTELPLLMNPPS